MGKHLKARGRHFELPIIENTLAEIRIAIDRSLMLIFRNGEDIESSLQIEETTVLSRGKVLVCLEGSRPGKTFAPQTLQPLVELVGCKVSDALAQKEGILRIAFSDASQILVTPSHGFEGWHFRWESHGDAAGPFYLHGATGYLIH